MDEIDTPQNRSNDDAEISKSSDENSFIGKMKVGVSKILPNSLSKWLSPKVDASIARRRRHDEIDSDDETANRNESPLAIATDSRYQTTPQLGAPPPNKKKKIFTTVLNRNTPDLYSSTAATPLAGERSNIISSTMIEDVPHRTNDQFNRFLPLENGQHAASSHTFAEDTVRDNASNYPDEASSSQSREKPANIFSINNDSSVVNFSAHLQRAKSLFTNRSYVSPRLRNYRMRNPRSSLYRSTSSLCDNNSVSSNASSAMSSPFYNGQTTFGGASSISRRMNPALNQDMQLHHRPKVPTNLVTSRSTSSLNSIGGSSASMSTTAKRILDVMNKYNTPLTEVRRISNALPSISETCTLSKLKSILDVDTTTNEIDKTKRTLLKPNTPYNRPFGRNPIESVLTNELHVPSMPELLQLKKFATNTMKIRDIASKSDNILNKPVATATNEFKLSKTVSNRAADGDIDASNNNKFVNNKNDAISYSESDTQNKQHINKIRTNMTRQKIGRRMENETIPEPTDVPNIALVLDKKAEKKLTETFKFQNSDQKNSTTTDNGLQIPFKSKSSNTSLLITPATKEKRTNGNDAEVIKKFEMSTSKPSVSVPASFVNAKPTPTTASVNASSTLKPALNNSKPSSPYRFNEPIVIKSTSNSFEQNKTVANTFHYKFSEPTFVGDKTDGLSETETTKSLNHIKFESKPIKGVSSDSGIADSTQSFDSNTSKSTGTLAARPVIAASTDNGFGAGKSVSSIPTQLKEDDTFKSLVAKQKQGKWECKDCMASNDASNDKCLCCGAANIAKEIKNAVKNAENKPAAVVDDVFKSIVAKQKQSKWECKDCMSQNDQAQPKCACCGGANPNASSNVTVNNTASPKSTFSFGTLPSSTSDTSKPLDSVFKAIIDKQKNTWECSSCLSANDVSKSKCASCEEPRNGSKGVADSAGSGITAAKPTFSFGSKTATTPQSGFSFGSGGNTAVTTASTFSFGNLAAKTAPSAQITFGSAKKEDKAKESVQSNPISAQFSFGNSTVLPSTSKVETVSKPTVATDNVQPVVQPDNVFMSIAKQQKSSSWECSSCMSKNANDVEKCACCETPKDGSAAKDTGKKDFGLSSSSKFTFGSPAGNTFSFGSMPDTKATPSQSGSLFGNTASTAVTSTPASTVTSTTSTTSSIPNIFGSGSSKPTFEFTASKPTTTESAAPNPALAGFQFKFGASATNNATAFGSKVVTKDETDTGPAKTHADNKGITILDNVVVKPATNGPVETPKPMFTFGQGMANQTTDDTASKAKKRSNADQGESNIASKFAAPSTGTFIFGQPPSGNNTSAMSGSTLIAPQVSNEPNSKFSFGTKTPTSAFPSAATAQPMFSAAPSSFAFNANNVATTTASSTFGSAATSPALNTPPSQPVFGSNAFSSPLGGFKAGPTFGSIGAPAFGTPPQNAEPQSQATPSPAAGLFQFGSTNNSAPLSSEQPKPEGFNFSLGSAPTFNFSEQSTQQQNTPFQFGAAVETQNMFSAQPSTAIQQRRKLRPVRRVNRP